MRPQGGCRSKCSILASASLARSYETHLGIYSRVIRPSCDSSRNDQTPCADGQGCASRLIVPDLGLGRLHWLRTPATRSRRSSWRCTAFCWAEHVAPHMRGQQRAGSSTPAGLPPAARASLRWTRSPRPRSIDLSPIPTKCLQILVRCTKVTQSVTTPPHANRGITHAFCIAPSKMLEKVGNARASRSLSASARKLNLSVQILLKRCAEGEYGQLRQTSRFHNPRMRLHRRPIPRALYEPGSQLHRGKGNSLQDPRAPEKPYDFRSHRGHTGFDGC